MKIFSAILAMKYLTYQIRRTATHVNFEIHKMLNFLSICSRDWNICNDYDLRDRLPLTGALTLMGTRKPIHHKAIFMAVFWNFYMILLNRELQIYANVAYQNPVDTPRLICKTFHGVYLFICKWNILKLIWSKICMFLNAGHSDNDLYSHKG